MQHTKILLPLTIVLSASVAVWACKPRTESGSAVKDAATATDRAQFLEGCGVQDAVSADRAIDAKMFGSHLFLSDAEIEDCIYKDLTSITDLSLIPNVRYLTLTHLYNAGSSAEEMLFYRGAVSKAINSLTYAPRVVRPQIVDPLGTIVRINLVDYEWDQKVPGRDVDRWDLVFNPKDQKFDHEEDFTAERGPNYSVHPAYPYYRDLPTYASNDKIYKNNIKYIYGRGDWFVSHATVPPLYHVILNMGIDDLALETMILGTRTRVEENIQVGRIARAGFDSSGVSSNNRMLERHEGRFKDSYYWKSYDFAQSVGKFNFKANPFGPCFRTIDSPAPFAKQLSQAALFKPCAVLDSDETSQRFKVFRQGGGEIIYSLPNGMQAYFLINSTGGRLSAGPANIVADLSNPVDKFTVINGRSCMFCHYQGMITGKEDEVGPAIRKLMEGQVYWDNRVDKKELELFVEKAHAQEKGADGKMHNKIAKRYVDDTKTFMRAEREVVGPEVYLTTDSAEAKKPFAKMLSLRRYNEVVNFLNDEYYGVVNRDLAAAEFGLTTSDMIKRIQDGQFSDETAQQFLNKFTRDNSSATLTRQQFEALYVKLAKALQDVPSTLGEVKK